MKQRMLTEEPPSLSELGDAGQRRIRRKAAPVWDVVLSANTKRHDKDASLVLQLIANKPQFRAAIKGAQSSRKELEEAKGNTRLLENIAEMLGDQKLQFVLCI